jgi:hypothetical protein
VPRSSVENGTVDHVVINAAVTGALSSVAQLTVPLGGTGAATITGVVKGNAAAAMTGMTGTAGGVTYWSNSSTLGTSALGVASQILQSNGVGAPTWVDPSANIMAGNGLTWSGTNTLAMINPVTTAIGGTGSNLINNMSAGVLQLTGLVGARTTTVVQIADPEISNSAAIARSKIAVGTIDSVVINDHATGALSSVTQLGVTMGGTGASGAITGMVKGGNPSMTGVTGTQYGATYWADANTIGSTAAGTTGYFLTANTGAAPTWTSPSSGISVDGTTLQWTLGVLGVKTPLITQYGGTGADLKSAATTGFVKMTGAGGSETMTVGNVFNVDVDANAAIARSKIAVGTIDSVVINDHATGALSSVTQLTVPLGGTGAATLTGMVKGNTLSALTAITGTQYGATYWSDANTIGSTAQGTNGYILRANGAGAPTWDTPSGVITEGTGLTWAGSTLNMDVPVLVANGGSGVTTLGSASTNGFLKMTGVAPNEVMGVSLIINTDIDNSAAIARSKVASGTANHVVINDAGGALSSEANLALSRGGTNAALTSDPVNKTILQFTPAATAVSTVTGTSSSTASTVVVRDASGNASFNAITLNSSSGPTIAAPTTSSVVNVVGSISTSSGVTAVIIQLTTAIGYAGIIKCAISAADATAAQNYGLFEAMWFWKRTAAGLEFNTTPSTKVVDKSNVASAYDITATISGTSIRINAAQGVLATTLYWTGKFDIIHNALA